MTVHLIRPCVGVQDIDQLYRTRPDHLVERDGEKYAYVYTRNCPRRQAELLDGGYLYWIMKRKVMCCQKICAIEEHEDEEGRKYCLILLSPQIMRTKPIRRKPFQGWRYLTVEDAPEITGAYHGGAEDLPEEMAEELTDLGLL